MIIDCIADLHGFYPKLEGGDLLVVAGDLTARNIEKEWHEFGTWMDKQIYEKIVFIAGNHDTMIEKWDKEQDEKGYQGPVSDPNEKIEYLCDSGTEVVTDGNRLKIWGTPWTPWFHGVNPKCKAFMKSDESLSDHWDKIPMGIDILITHGPAFGVLDGIPLEDGTLYHAGSKSLYGWLKYVERPRLHIFGHIHEAYGQEEHFPTYLDNMMLSVNCSHVNERYKPVNKPIRIVYERGLFTTI